MNDKKVTFVDMAKEDLPDYLKSYNDLAQYFRAQLNDLTT